MILRDEDFTNWIKSLKFEMLRSTSGADYPNEFILERLRSTFGTKRSSRDPSEFFFDFLHVALDVVCSTSVACLNGRRLGRE